MGPHGEPLLRPAFLERLRAARGLLFRRRRGERRGVGYGQAPEFEANRPYDPGDDPRYIDWNLYARLEQLWVKLYALDNESQVGILVDCSRSMREPRARKQRAAARFAAAFSYLALSAGRNLRLGAFAEGLLTAHGPWRSLRQLPSALHFCEALPHGGRTDLERAAGEFLAGGGGRGILIVVSDLFQERDVLRALDGVATRGTALHVVQVVEEDELRPTLRGELTVRDLEGEETLTLSVGDDVLADLARSVAAHGEGVAALCRRRGAPYLRALAGESFEELFLDHVLARRGGAA